MWKRNLFATYRQLACFVTLILVCVVSQAQSSHTPIDYNPQNWRAKYVIQGVSSPWPSTDLVVAHRGGHSFPTSDADNPNPHLGIAENSREAILAAARDGVELIEVDIRMTSDGVPVLSHDTGWGRETNVGCAENNEYNPNTGKGANDKVNSQPLSFVQTENTTQNCGGNGIFVRDSFTNTQTVENPMTLQQTIDFFKANKIGAGLVLDIKDQAALNASIATVLSNKDIYGGNFVDDIIFKVPATQISPATVVSTFSTHVISFLYWDWEYFHVMPYYTTGQIVSNAFGPELPSSPSDPEANVRNNMNTWLYGTVSGCVLCSYRTMLSGMEIGLKQTGGILTSAIDNLFASGYDPSNYQPVPETLSGYYNDGSCAPCKQLSDFFFHGTGGLPSDTDDQRASPDFQLATLGTRGTFTNHVITTDNYLPMIKNLASAGRRRNMSCMTTYGTCSGPAEMANCNQMEANGNPIPCGGAPTPCQAGTGACAGGGTPCNTGTGPCAGGGTPCNTGTGPCVVNAGDIPTVLPGAKPGDLYSFPASSSATFSVNAGATTFTATQPNDSIATYVWSDGGGKPSEWLTSASGSTVNAALEYVPVGDYAGVSPSATITVNAGTTFQTIDGFGGAMTDSAASLILGSSNRNAIMDTLFGTDATGGGMTIVRSPMGSSDLMADPNDLHSYEDTQGNFSVTGHPSDNRQITALQQAKQLAGGNFKLLGTPWTAPGWMKYGGSTLPSSCGTQANEFNTAFVSQYAQYFTNYVNAYASLGLTPWMVSMQNEPENCQTTMPTTIFSSNDEVAFAAAIKGKLPDGVKVMGWDHNWNDENYVSTLVSNNSVDAIGYHCYDGTNYDNQTQAVPTYFTECSGFTTGNANVATNLGWEVANNIMGPLRFGSRGSLYWSLAMDPNGNPHYGGAAACGTCRGMITVNSDGSFSPSQDYYFWAQFSKFVAPGAVRVDSNNSGNLSTIAFHKGTTNVLVVLNSASAQANGGSPGSDAPSSADLRGSIVQWNGDTKAQKTAWLVGSDGHRRWISDLPTYSCLQGAGIKGPFEESSATLDEYINLDNVWAVCGAVTMGTDSELELNTYLKSTNGARLTLTSGGLRTVDSTGTTRWAPGGSGNRLILQEDQNLVLYSGNTQVWTSNTAGSGAIWLSLRDDGSFALFNKANQEVWHSPIQDASWYKERIVQWDRDPAAQKSSWLVGADGNRRWIPDLPTFQCLQGAGKGNSLSVSSDLLNLLPNLNNVWATCGGTQIGVNGSLESSTKMVAGSYTLVMQSDGNLVEYNSSGGVVWASGTNGKGAVQLILQSDGNLVLYNQSRGAVWTTGTNGQAPGWLILGSDGNLKLFNASGAQVWSR